MVLIFLGALCPNFLNTRPNVIGNSIVKSLEDISHFLCNVVPTESQKPANVETQDRSPLVVQGRTEGGRSRGIDFGAKGRGRGRDGGHSRGRVEEVIYYHYCKEPGHTKYNCSLLQGKQ